ncbi:acyltransferase [Amnimonas aquatica]|nr:acyltransferase [Amnimonas aquatica]
MLSFLPAPLLGFIVGTLLIANTVLHAIVILLFSPLKLLALLAPPLAPAVRRTMAAFQENWTALNGGIFRLLPRIDWDIRGLDGLRRDQWYFVVANHQCWVDILAVFHALNRRVPPLKIFIKQELLYVPVVGLAVYALDYPFMKRYSKELLAKKPQLRGKDLETTRAACAKYQGYPVSVMSYLEGTRITPGKHAATASPYRHLLRPKSAGAAFVLSALGTRMESLLDMTIAYPDGIPSFWDFCRGRVRRIIIEVSVREIPAHFCLSSYENDEAYRNEFQSWVGSLWADKDNRLDALLRS